MSPLDREEPKLTGSDRMLRPRGKSGSVDSGEAYAWTRMRWIWRLRVRGHDEDAEQETVELMNWGPITTLEFS